AVGRAQVAVVLGEDAAHVGDGAGRVVGGGFHQHRDAMRRVAFVQHFGEVGRVLAGSALDRRLDLVLGHVDSAGVGDHAPQMRIGGGVGAAVPDGDGD